MPEQDPFVLVIEKNFPASIVGFSRDAVDYPRQPRLNRGTGMM